MWRSKRIRGGARTLGLDVIGSSVGLAPYHLVTQKQASGKWAAKASTPVTAHVGLVSDFTSETKSMVR